MTRVEDDPESGVLETHLGVERLSPPAFVRAHVLARLDALPGRVRDRAMLGVIASIPSLSASDRGIGDALARAPFVPTSSGGLAAPAAGRLYHHHSHPRHIHHIISPPIRLDSSLCFISHHHLYHHKSP